MKKIFFKAIIAILNLLFFSYTSTAQIMGDFPIENFSPSVYRAGNQNNDFDQNQNQSIFIANNLGVLRFNGNSWKRQPLPNGIKARSLKYDPETERLYVGGQGDFGYFDPEWNYCSLSVNLKSSFGFEDVWDIYINNDIVYFCTFKAIYLFDGNQIEEISLNQPLLKSFEIDGQLYVQSKNHQLYKLIGNQLQQLSNLTFYNPIQALFSFGNGFLSVTNDGAIEYHLTEQSRQIFPELSNMLRGKYVNNSIFLTTGLLAIATQIDGIYLFNPSTNEIQHINQDNGLMSNSVLRLFEDFNHNVWAGTQNGISLIDTNSPMRLINESYGLFGSGYSSIRTDGLTYFTTSNGIFYRNETTKESKQIENTEGPGYELTQIGNSIYAGHHKGLYQLIDGRAKLLLEANGIWQIKELVHSNFFIAGSYDGLFLIPKSEGGLGTPSQVANFQESSRFIEEDSQGRLWVSQYYKAVYRMRIIDNKTVEIDTISTNFGLPEMTSNIISKVNGKIVFATSRGIYQWDENSDHVIQSPQFYAPFGDQEIYSIKEDDSGNVLVIGQNNIGLFIKTANDKYNFIPSSLYQRRYDFNNDLLHTSIIQAGSFLVSANQGFINYLYTSEQLNDQEAIQIKSISNTRSKKIYYSNSSLKNGKVLDPGFKIPYGENQLKFDVESFDYVEQNSLQYRYRLEGLDQDFSEWTEQPSVEYINLKEGKYEFVAQVKNSVGTIGTTSTVNFSISPPFYRSLVFRLFLLLIAMSLIAYGYLIQQKRYKERTKILEDQKQKEIDERQSRLKELQNRSEEKIGQLKEENIESELKHLNNLLSASTMNLVVKNEFINNIKDQVQEVKDQAKNKVTADRLDTIVKEIDHSLRLQEDWQQFEYHFDQVHGDFLNRVRETYPDLTPQDQKLIAYLRLNLQTKEIAQLMSISIRGVEIARYRLRKRLDLNTNQNLTKYILEF